MTPLPPWALVLDIETTDTRPTARVLAIGIALVDTRTRATVAIDNIRIDLHEQAFRSQSDETMAFWSSQPVATLFEAFFAKPRLHPVDALNALSKVAEEYAACGGLTVWGNGSSFDLVILEDLYRHFGCRVPWTHRQHRDLRTLYELAGVKVSDVDRAGLTSHVAVYDALAEARAMVRALDTLFGPPPIAAAATKEASQPAEED